MTKRSPTARSYPVRVPRVPVGPLAPMVLGECSGWLAGLGYSPGSAAGVVNVLERLSWWMQLVGAGVDDIDEDLLARHTAKGRRRRLTAPAARELALEILPCLVAGQKCSGVDSAIAQRHMGVDAVGDDRHDVQQMLDDSRQGADAVPAVPDHSVIDQKCRAAVLDLFDKVPQE